MKSLFLGLIAALSIGALAAKPQPAKYYSCGGVGDVDEYVAAINLEESIASFFDNDSYSYLKLTETYSLESNPPQEVMVFEGDDASYEGKIKVVFNLTKLHVYVTSTNGEGGELEFGEASCKAVDYWEK